MSSLLQFSGTVTKRGVGLQFVKVEKYQWIFDPERYAESNGTHGFIDSERDVETFTCSQCGREHAYIHIAFRQPLGLWGPWVEFRWNNEIHVPDLSIPISETRIPRDAVRQSQEESERIWHS